MDGVCCVDEMGAEVCFLWVLFAGESVSREGKVRTTTALDKQIMNM
jgi:hypothetical protein